MAGRQPGRGAGWLGFGAPLEVRQNYRIRPLEDGATLCLPGRWTPSKRRLPDVGTLVDDLVEAMELDAEVWERRIFEMLVGKLAVWPFTQSEIAKGTDFLTAWATKRGFPPSPSPKDVEQGPKIRLMQSFLRACEAPDAEAMDCFATGYAWATANACPVLRRSSQRNKNGD